MNTTIFDAHIELNTSCLPASGEEILKNMSTYQASKAIVVPTTDDAADRSFEIANGKLLEFCNLHPDVFIPFCRLQPKMGVAAVESLKTYLDNGFRGLFLAPEQEQFYIDHCLDLFRTLDARQKPLLLVTQKHLTRYPRYWQGAIEKFPNLPFIMAHAGQADYRQAIEMAVELPNVYLETSALNRLRTQAVLEGVDHRKIVFASGYPVSDGRIEKIKYEILHALEPSIACENIQSLLK